MGRFKNELKAFGREAKHQLFGKMPPSKKGHPWRDMFVKEGKGILNELGNQIFGYGKKHRCNCRCKCKCRR